MAKHYPGQWILRTVLFTPGHNEKYIDKAFASNADCVVLDLEDAVPESSKQQARKTIKRVLTSHKKKNSTVFVRINPLESGYTLLDLDEVACREVDGFVFPKAYCSDDIKAFDAQLTLKERMMGIEHGHFSIIILVETPRAVLNSHEMSIASKRVVGLLFGCEDYLTEMQGSHGIGGRSLLVPRHLMSMAARAAGVIPIDAPYVQVHDERGLEEHIVQGKELGYEGILVMTLGQIEMARKLYTPSEGDIEEAKKMVEAAGMASGDSKGIIMSGDKFVSPPTLKRAKRIIRRLESIREFEKYTR